MEKKEQVYQHIRTDTITKLKEEQFESLGLDTLTVSTVAWACRRSSMKPAPASSRSSGASAPRRCPRPWPTRLPDPNRHIFEGKLPHA